jgi:hypothetical protein
MNWALIIDLSFAIQMQPTIPLAKLLHMLQRNLAHSFGLMFFPFLFYGTLLGSSAGTGQARS